MKTFKEFLSESIIDARREGLAPEVFEGGPNPKLKPAVRLQVQQGIRALRGHGVDVEDYRMIGSILTRRYSADSDLDINVLISGDIDRAIPIADHLSGHKIQGTTHDLNFHVLNDRKVWQAANDDADGVFDVENNKFDRVPADLPFNVEKYWDKYRKIASTIDYLTGKLKGEIHNHEQLKSLSRSDLASVGKLARNHLRQMEELALKLVDIHKIIHKSRNELFAKPMSPEDLMMYGEKNRTPANVLYKLLERYHYMNLLKTITDIIGPDKSLTPKEVQELKSLFSKEGHKG